MEMNPDTTTDVLAVVKEVGDLADLMSKSQKPLKKRELVLADQSGYQVRLTLWGRQAESFSFSSNDAPVIGIKGAKIGEFGGRSLSCGFDSALQINPDSPEAHRLKGWWDQEGASTTFQVYTSSGGAGGGAYGGDVTKTITAVTEEGIGMDGKVFWL